MGDCCSTEFIVKIISRLSLLGKVVVSVFGPFLPLQILLLDEDVDALLNHLDLGLEPSGQLVQDLRHQLLMLQHLPRLHNPDDGSLD